MKNRKVARIALLALVVWSLCAPLALAQTTTGLIKGTIAGPDGNPIAGARVTVVLQGATTPQPRSVTTDERGAYLIEGLAPGIYQLTVEAEGFKSVVVGDVELAGDAQEMKFSLEAGSAQETIVVAPEVYPTPPA